MKKTDRPPFNELAKPNMSKEAKAVMEEAMQKSCDDQDKFVKDAVKLITEQYGEALKKLAKT